MTGQFVVFVDADDYIAERYIETMHGCVADDIDMVVSCPVHVKENEAAKPDTAQTGSVKIPFDTNYDVSDYYRHYTIWGTLIRKELTKDTYFESGLYVGEDTVYYYTILKRCRNIAFMYEKMYFYVEYDDSALHGAFNARRHTELDSWEKVIQLFSDMKDVQKHCCAEDLVICVRIYRKLMNSGSKDSEYAAEMCGRIRKDRRYIKYMRNYKKAAYMLCVSPACYNLYAKIKKKQMKQ